MNRGNIQIILGLILIVFGIGYTIIHFNETNKNDLSTYKGYRVKSLFIGRMDSHIILIGHENDTIDKHFMNTQIEEAIKGLIIK